MSDTRTRRGTCKICKRSIAASGMGRHLQTHIPKVGRRTHYVIRVDDRGPFWMFLQVPATFTLKRIDAYLRNTWLECCGHLSMFIINGTIYDSDPDDEFVRNKSMNYKIHRLLREKMTFRHEYDFGTTTTLRLTVTAGIVPPLISSKKIVPVAVHDKVSFHCDICGREATKVCAYCGMDQEGLLCDTCAPKHSCALDGDEPFLKPVQSPRVGMCAYEYEPYGLHD